MRFKRLLFLLFTLVFASTKAGGNFTIKTIVIDAGHGGKDPGATGPGKTNEKDVALAVALKLGENIQKNFPDVNVIYTRKTDVFIELHERAEIANKNKADLFIAVHCNSTPTPVAYGTSTYVLGLHRTEANLEVAKRENAVILMEDDHDKHYEIDPNSDAGNIMMSMKQNAFLDQSIDIASKIESQYEGGAKRKSLGVKQAGFYVLYKTTMPSILSEIGFISNPNEEKFLTSAKGQEQIAASLFKAFKDYKFEMENSEGEQFAYQEAKRKAESTVDSAPKVQKAPVDETVKSSTPAVKEVKPAVKPNVSSTEPEIDNTIITTASGRKIRKPIDNASGGGVALVAVKQIEPTPAKTEPKPAAKTEPKAAPEVIEPKKEVTETKTSMPVPEVKREPVKKTEPVIVKPAAEGKKVVAGNSGGAVITAPKNEAIEKPVVVENKTVKAEPKPEPKSVEKAPVVTKKEDKPVTSIKPAAKTTGAEAGTPSIVKPAAESGAADGVMTFKVQLIALKGPMKSSEVTKVTKVLGEISNEPIPSGLIRYYAGNSKTYSEAKRKAAVAAENGYIGAFVVGFKNGVRFGPEKLKPYENQ